MQAGQQPAGGDASQEGADTAYRKVFVGGLPWATSTDSLRAYFAQFGEITEAVVIVDRQTGRSKGYGFTTFASADAAARAVVDPNPVIDGRRANCNLAYIGAKRRDDGLQHNPGYQGQQNYSQGYSGYGQYQQAYQYPYGYAQQYPAQYAMAGYGDLAAQQRGFATAAAAGQPQQAYGQYGQQWPFGTAFANQPGQQQIAQIQQQQGQQGQAGQGGQGGQQQGQGGQGQPQPDQQQLQQAPISASNPQQQGQQLPPAGAQVQQPSVQAQ